MKIYQGFIVAVKTDFAKNIAFYFPLYSNDTLRKVTQNQLGFYWINGDKLVTVTNSDYSDYESNDDYFIWIEGMIIYNDRNNYDEAYLHSSHWSGKLVGTDGYPETNKNGNYYCIGGGKN